ncbi:MAG: hypothetical protein A2452_12540 [Candidatus Firestonebacteria bacterium RIFOXYC2_FULL_39_67]|nr:MAG: hypothetical protein A2536_05740 [Candidatus Firestonebacteria bacterium RIFOXYD2_FULL_39_29]OGF52582.1 MAG: hypothetical protein A2497_00495 [Candidatus Firestonebacteria bacterium RifOxyC12_full_39_7]OGF57393.1 MAG: hypothetical protein A2452_12540 [Candidatus Firestonebacteria bacterium RIFOXYC2_FULL_39_67]
MKSLKGSYDLVVVGGGPGGFSAAIAAAKRGISVLLVERYGFLGGMATSGLVNPFMPYKLNGKNLTSEVFNDLIDRLEKENALSERQMEFDDEKMKTVLDEMLKDAGCDVLLHSYFTGCEVSKGIIKSVTVVNKSGKVKIKGKVFVDSTGDGDLSAAAGAKIEIGRPEDSLCQPMTLCFRIGGVKQNLPGPVLGKQLNEILFNAKKNGEVEQPRENVLFFDTLIPGCYHFNTTRVVKKSGVNGLELSEAEIEGRRQVKELFNLFRQKSPYFKNSYLMKVACQIGIRETRRVMGSYVINERDIVDGSKFEDGIARSDYPVDIHNPAGSGTIIKRVKAGTYYEVPFRCLIPKGFKNILVGSRCISSTHAAHSSLRVMPVVSGIGEACGIAAAMAIKDNILPYKVDGKKVKEKIFK